MSEASLEAARLHTLLTWFSPAFPIGAYTYSHGLEYAVEAGDVRGEADLIAWVEDVLRYGSGWSDAVLTAASHRADAEALIEIAALAAALSPTRERHLEATAQGRAFAEAVLKLDDTQDDVLAALVARRMPLALPVVVGAAAARCGLGLRETLDASLHAFTANLVSAGVRLVPLGQTAGLRALKRLAPVCIALATRAEASTIDDLGGSAFLADVASCKHETQHTRLFRS